MALWWKQMIHFKVTRKQDPQLRKGRWEVTGTPMTGQEVELMNNVISPKRGQREADHQKFPANRKRRSGMRRALEPNFSLQMPHPTKTHTHTHINDGSWEVEKLREKKMESMAPSVHTCSFLLAKAFKGKEEKQGILWATQERLSPFWAIFLLSPQSTVEESAIHF